MCTLYISKYWKIFKTAIELRFGKERKISSQFSVVIFANFRQMNIHKLQKVKTTHIFVTNSIKDFLNANARVSQ